MNTGPITQRLTPEQLAKYPNTVSLSADQMAFLQNTNQEATTQVGDERPFQSWQDIHPNQIRIKLTQADVKELLDLGFVASLHEQDLISQFILREYFTSDIFEQLADFHRLGNYAKKYMYFRISTALALHKWLLESCSPQQDLAYILRKLRKALINQKLIRL